MFLCNFSDHNIRNKRGLSFKKSLFSQLKKKGYFKIYKKPNLSKDFFKIDEVLKSLRDNSLITEMDKVDNEIEDISIDKENLFNYVQPPMTKEQEIEYQKKQLEELQSIKELQQEAQSKKVDGSQAEWNKYLIMERALKTALERKEKERILINIDEAKNLIESFMTPIIQKMDNLAYEFKTNFPNLEEESLLYLQEYINNIKIEAQNYVI